MVFRGSIGREASPANRELVVEHKFARFPRFDIWEDAFGHKLEEGTG